MEEKFTDANGITMKKEHLKLKKECEITETCTAVNLINKEPKEEETSSAETGNSKYNTGIAKKEQNTGQLKSVKNKNRALKRKLREDGVTIERVLSEGEASSDFETVSSMDSKLDFEDIELSSSNSEHDYNVIVHIANDLTYQNNRNSDKRRYYWKSKRNSKIEEKRHDTQSEHFLGKYSSLRQVSLRNYKQLKHWERKNEGLHQRYNGVDRCSREDDDYSRRRSFERERSRCSDHSIRSQRSSSNDRTYRRLKENSTVYTNTFRENSEHNYKFTGSRSSSYKGREMESKNSRFYSKPKSGLNRNLPCTTETYCKSRSTSVWKRLGKDGTRERLKKDLGRSSRRSNTGHHRKKERTPFLVELERKLKETESQKNVSKANSPEKDERNTPATVKEVAPMPAGSQNPNLQNISCSQNTSLVPTNPEIYSAQCPSMPTLSVDNLPLVPGPTGLPVHVTTTGEQIPHDMEGRRIPFSPNGYYLPLDPTGRLFAHIVSPGNQAVPIHITEDGVLRLPNSEPIPYGPSHNLPVNIDGSVIPIGPDSKPICPCPNLPRQPPLHLLQMTQSDNVEGWQTKEKKIATADTCEANDERTPNLGGSSDSQLQPVQSDLLDFLRGSYGKASKADLLINYQKRARERKEDVLKCREIEKNLGVSPSKGGVKRSTPMKFSQKKALKDEIYSDCEVILDSSDSDSVIASKSTGGAKKDLPLDDDGAQNALKVVQGNENCMQSGSEDFIIVKIQQALKSLTERNYKPPALGRFIISEVVVEVLMETSPNVSPLLRNRVKLPFLMEDKTDNLRVKDESATVEKSEVIFSFLSEEKSLGKGEKAEKLVKAGNKNLTKFPVFTFDFAMQCDFTSVILKNLNSKISEMEMEVVRLRNINANLLDGFRNVHEVNEKKSEELRKALSEIEKRNNEILSLKRLINEKGK